MSVLSAKALAIRVRTLIDIHAGGSVTRASAQLSVDRDELAQILRAEHKIPDPAMLEKMVRAWRPDPLWLVTGEHDVQKVSLPPGHENQVLFVLEQLQMSLTADMPVAPARPSTKISAA